MKKALKSFGTLSILASSIFSTFQTQATIVEFDTSEGSFQVSLFDETTPETVANFLNYINNGSYNNNIVHRKIGGFILQSGSYSIDLNSEENLPLKNVETNSPIRNEPKWANIAGTIAMAKLSNNVNSATAGWFINLDNNNENLDVQNGGFTTFGQVINGGMDVVNAIAAIPNCSIASPNFPTFSDLPIKLEENQTCSSLTSIEAENVVIINSITIIDETINTVGDLRLIENELLDSDGDGQFNFIDDDDDNDDVLDINDLYPWDSSESADSDGDGVPDNTDVFPNDPNETADLDGDTIGDNSDPDIDNDEVLNEDDAFPRDETESTDTDNDGVGDNSDWAPNDPNESRDVDGDGVGDNADAFPLDSTETLDSDEDGVGDNTDAFPNDDTEWFDNDLDGIGDNADPDDDNNGILDVDEGNRDSGSSGGSTTLFSMMLLSLFGLFRNRKLK